MKKLARNYICAIGLRQRPNKGFVGRCKTRVSFFLSLFISFRQYSSCDFLRALSKIIKLYRISSSVSMGHMPTPPRNTQQKNDKNSYFSPAFEKQTVSKA